MTTRAPILDGPAGWGLGSPRRRAWVVAAGLLAAGLFAQAISAGAMLSGEDWARRAHMVCAVVVTAGALGAGALALIALRRVPGGLRLGLMFLALGGLILLQMLVGRMASGGANVMWLHVPLGVALIGVAARAMAVSRSLG